eukprot:m.211065 g.211065  ORF g.211065 m.211065 type:complete len:93 (+) comp15490_c0_seq6:6196-6474(+)
MDRNFLAVEQSSAEFDKMRFARALRTIAAERAGGSPKSDGLSTEAKNWITLGVIGAFVVGTYTYSMNAVTQEDFSDVEAAAIAVPTNPPQKK